MSGPNDALSVAVTAAEIAWPIILGICFILMIGPFIFLIVAKSGDDPDDPSR